MGLSLDRDVMPTVPVVLHCTRCESPVLVPAGLSLRIPATDPPWCHETVDMKTGKVYRSGNQ